MLTPAQRNQRLILLEFNELCPHLVDRFIDEGALPNFKRLREASETFITHTNEEVLEPWIQWVTVHTGVPFSEHGIKDLDEAEKVTHDTFWDDLAEENVLLMSPMNVKFRRRNQSLFMPDPWAASQVPSAELEPFYNFIRAAVNSHARTDRLDLKVAAKAVRFLLAHGLKLNTLTAAFNQLFVERFGRRDAKWRRATILDRLLWDVFAYFWRGPRQPRVGIFFSNATAHYQHKYWSHHDPAQFSLKPDADEVETYGNVIRFGYQAHDRLIGKAMALAEAGTAIALCTALSQNGYDVHLLCPTPEAFGGWPVLRPWSGMRVFRSIRLRGSRSVGSLLVATSPAVWMRAPSNDFINCRKPLPVTAPSRPSAGTANASNESTYSRMPR